MLPLLVGIGFFAVVFPVWTVGGVPVTGLPVFALLVLTVLVHIARFLTDAQLERFATGPATGNSATTTSRCGASAASTPNSNGTAFPRRRPRS
jgi:hypothetical protein